MDIGRLLDRYARVLSLGGGLLAAAALVLDPRWLAHPVATLILTLGVVVLRASPVRLSKYSYLTQSGVAVLVGAVTIGPSPRSCRAEAGSRATDSLSARRRMVPVMPRAAQSGAAGREKRAA